MFDFFPLPSPQWIQKIAVPLSEKINAPTLPLHLHQIIYTAALYQFTLTVISPICSGYLFGDKYKKLAPRTKFNWDVHVVSLVQSLIVTTLALYVAFNDKERAAMSWQERVYGYTGACGLVQAFATGYFVWDLWICARYIHMFGIGMLAHAVSALNVYGFGYRPFVNFYSTSFMMYELSSPFLNIHWFCDKLGATGSPVQLINGVFLLTSFGGARLLYGTYVSANLWYDIFRAARLNWTSPHTPPLALSVFALNATTLFESPMKALEVVKFAPATPYIPVWMWASYLVSNFVLHVLNWYWYGKMISAIRKRFDPPIGTRTKDKVEKQEDKISTSTDASGRQVVSVDHLEVRKRQPLERLESHEIPPPN